MANKKKGNRAKSAPQPGNQTTTLLTMAKESEAVFYRDEFNRLVVDPDGLANRVFQIGSNASRQWLESLFYEQNGRAPSSDAVRQALRILEENVTDGIGPVPQDILERMAANAAILREAQGSNDQQRSQAAVLVDLAQDQGIELFHDERTEPYLVLPSNGRREICAVNSQMFRRWLAGLMWQKESKAPSRDAIASAVNVLSCMATFDGPEHYLYVRVAWHQGALWYDLGDGRAVRITVEGWEVVDIPPILFRRYPHQRVQLEPTRAGNFNRIFEFIPTRNQDDSILYGTTAISYLLPGSPRAGLSFAGPQGSGKSTAGKLTKRLVDPSKAASIRRITNFRELQLQLEHNWLLNIDNVTSLPFEISDALSAAITGDSDLRRQLYTDQDMVILDYMRPILLNGITHAPQRPDLLDRIVLITLERIAPERRKEEEALWPEFDAALPEILGGAFDIISKAMSLHPTVRLASKQRMADFTTWGYAISEAAGWGGSRFLAAYERNIKRQHEEAVAASVVAQVVVAFIENHQEWQGPASELKPELDEVATQQGVDVKDRRSGWPADAPRLSKELRRLAETLTASGVEVTFPAQGKKRSIRLRQVVESTVGSVGDEEVTVGYPHGNHATDGADGNFDGRSGGWRAEI